MTSNAREGRSRRRQSSLATCERGGTDFVELLCIFALVVVVGAMGAYAFGQSTERAFDDNTQRVATFGDGSASANSTAAAGGGASSGISDSSTGAEAGEGETAAESAAAAASHGSNYAGIAETGSASANVGLGKVRTAVDYMLVGVFVLIAIAIFASVVSRLKRRRKRREATRLKSRAERLGEVMNTHISTAATGTAGGPTQDMAGGDGGSEFGLPSVIVSI